MAFPPPRRLLLACCLYFTFSLAHVASGQGTGLTGQYYDTAAFSTLRTTRTDASLNFSWGTTIPTGTTLTAADTYSVAWTGQIGPEFTELYTFYVTADDGARLWIDNKLIAMRTFLQSAAEFRGQVRLVAGQKVNIRLEYIQQTGTASVRLEWSSASRAREIIPTDYLYPTSVDRAGGSLLKEHWTGIAGGTISSLTGNANYPNKPSGREFVTGFECLAQNWADSYGTRVTGYLVPPATGNYFFAVSGDDIAELYLSTDATAANKQKIAFTTGATTFRQWDANGSQQSTSRALVQGQRYFVEVLHKESTGNDHWSVGWKAPGDTAFSVIPGSALVQAGIERAQPSQTSILDTLARDHPRLFATPERFAALKAKYLSPEASKAKSWAESTVTTANTILTQPPNIYTQDIRGTILGISRSVVTRVYALGVAWWITGDNQYAERAWTELDEAAKFPDWHPAHFLDTAEMTNAFAVGYDWFYHYWTPERRTIIREAIKTKGLTPGLSQHTSNAGWTRPTSNNWNLVCNGGLSMGALALGTEEETLVEDILHRAMNSARPVLKRFTTDNGNWYEGPGYWGYTMEYTSRFLTGLEWVLGSDFGISNTRNLSESGMGPIYSAGSSNLLFNYADAGAGGPNRGPEFAWLARRYNEPLFNWWENQSTNGGPLGALWQVDSNASLLATNAPPDFAFHGEATTTFPPQEMVSLRGNWADTRTTFVAGKAGEMGAAHGNLDAGTFVLDALGKRWFHDLGGDNYALLNYFNGTPNANGVDRWDYYRMRGEGQNTLVINPGSGPDLVLGAVAPVISFQTEPAGNRSFFIHDLTPAHTGITRVWRGVQLMNARKEVLIQDEIQAAAGKTVWWFAHYTHPTTTVVIDPDGTSAMMTQGAERMWCKIVSGDGTFQIRDAVPLPTSPNPNDNNPDTLDQNLNTGFKKLTINLTNVTNTTLAVWFVPLSQGAAIPTSLPAITPLNTWNVATESDPPQTVNGNGTLEGESYVDIDLRQYVADDATPSEQMRFAVSAPVNGTVVLLADGYTARFTPTPNYVGVPQFTYTATDTTTDPRAVLTYDFDGPDYSVPGTVPDASGNGRDGTIQVLGAGSATYVTTVPAALGRAGRALDLVETGTADIARITRLISTSELNFNTSDWTITGWFKRRDTTNEDIVAHIGSGDGFGGTDELYLMAHQTNRLSLHHYGAAQDVDITTTTVPAGAWRHFAMVREGAQIRLYLDGALIGTDSAFMLNMDHAFPLVIGGHTSTTFAQTRWFDGQVDEIGVFNDALSPAEITTLAGGMTVRHFGGLSATGTITLSEVPVAYNWTAPATGTWSTGANWQGGAAPESSRGNAVLFFNGATLTGGSITANQNLGANFQLNSLTLAGTSTAATAVTVTGSSIQFLPNGSVAPTVNLNAANGSGLTFDFNLAATLASTTTFAGTGNATFRFNGDMTGAGGLTKTGSSTLVLAGNNSFDGDILIGAGTLQVGNDGATGALGSGTITNNGTLRVDRTGVLTVSNNITGTGQVRIECPISAGTVELTGTNDFLGNVTVASGFLRINNSTALGDGNKTLFLTNGTAGNPQLRLNGTDNPIELSAEIAFQTSNSNGAIVNEAGENTIGGPITLTGGGGDTRINSLAGTLALLGDIAPNTTSRNLRLGGAGKGVINGQIRDGTAPNVLVGLNKVDAGTWTINGPITHTGTISLTTGALYLNGNVTAASSVTAATGTTLGGSGSISAGTTISGNHEPGPAGAGTQSFTGNLSYGNASRIQWELTGNSELGADLVDAGAVTVTAGAAINVRLNGVESQVSFADPFWQMARVWPVITHATRTGTFALGTITADSLGVARTAFGAFSLQHTAGAVNLVWTPVNQPPSISDLTDIAISEDTSTGALPFTVADNETAAGSLTLSAQSSNPGLIPLGNIVFGGSGANRTVTIAPAANAWGTSTITITVTDGNTATAVDTFVVLVNAVNDLPTITNIANQTINEDVATAALAFTIGDVETAAGSLTLSAGSSNTTLVPVGNVVFGGSGASRTVTVTPAANQFGTSTITVTVTDANTGTINDTFLLTVNSVNDLPTITDIANQTINEDAATTALAFSIGDVETAAGSLTLSAGSSNTTLVPVGNVVFGGSGANRTVTVTPAANQFGTSTITVTVTDANSGTINDTFLLTVNSVNDLPTITDIANQSINEDASTTALAFTIGDLETPAASLTLSAASSNSTLVPVGNVVFGGSGANRTVTVTPVANQFGTATITVTVTDANTGTASDTFNVLVNAQPTISALANQTWDMGYPGGALSFVVGDAESAADTLTVTSATSNAALVPLANILLAGTGTDRTVTLTPVAGQVGIANITLTVSDGATTAQRSFTLTVTNNGTQGVWSATGTSGALLWSAGANWASGQVPTDGSAATLSFLPGTTLAAGTITSQNDVQNPFDLNVLTLGGSAASGATAVLQVTGNPLRFLSRSANLPVINLDALNGSGTRAVDMQTAIALGQDTTAIGNGTAAFKISGPVSGTGSLTKAGTSTLTLTGNNTYAGGTTIAAGTLQIGDNTPSGTLGTGAITNNGTLVFYRSDDVLNVASTISGTGSILVGMDPVPANASRVTFSGANTFTGGVSIRSGGLRITNSDALGDRTVTKTILVRKNGSFVDPRPQLLLNGASGPIVLPANFSFSTTTDDAAYPAIRNEAGDNAIHGEINMTSGGGGTRIASANGTLALHGNIYASTTGRVLTLDGTARGTVFGAIQNQNATNVLAVTKSGTGTWVLEGTNTYTGNTTVQAGTLTVNGSIITGGAVTVNAGAILSGRGTIASTSTINGVHSPGDGIGTQTFTNTANYRATSHLLWQLATQSTTGPGTNFDKVQAGTVAITAGAVVDISLNAPGSTVNLSNTFWTQARTWNVLSGTAITGTFTLGNVGADPGGRAASTYGTFSLQQTTTAVNVVWAPKVPFQQWQQDMFGADAENPAIASETSDPDGDGISNASEFVAGTNPTNANDGLFATATSWTAQTMTVHVSGKAGRIYALERKTLLSDATWVEVSRSAVLTEDGDVYLTDPSHPTGSGFYRTVAIYGE